MPRTRYAEKVNAWKAEEQQAKRDRIREKLRGAYREQGCPIEELSKALGLSRSMTYTMMRQPGGKWKLRDLIVASNCLHIPMDELTPFMTMQHYGGSGQ